MNGRRGAVGDEEILEDDALLEEGEPLDDGSLDEVLDDRDLLEDDALDDGLGEVVRDEDTTAHRPVPERPVPHRGELPRGRSSPGLAATDDVPTGRLVERSIHREPVRATRRRRDSSTTQQDAALFDTVVVPQWVSLFGGALVDRVPRGFRGQMLDACAGTGYPSLELLKKIDPAGRIVAIDRDSALLELLRRRAIGVAGKQLFARAESLEALSFGDEVFDLVVACALPGPTFRERAALSELRRVMVVGGRLLASSPLAGTFEEVLDMFREVALRRESASLSERVEALAARHPTRAELEERLAAAGFERISVVESERQLVFRTAREVFGHPVLRHVALAEWRTAAGFEAGGEDVLAEVEHALATYLPRGPISLSVRVGVIEATRT